MKKKKEQSPEDKKENGLVVMSNGILTANVHSLEVDNYKAGGYTEV